MQPYSERRAVLEELGLERLEHYGFAPFAKRR
jgi:hypothetical protein